MTEVEILGEKLEIGQEISAKCDYFPSNLTEWKFFEILWKKNIFAKVLQLAWKVFKQVCYGCGNSGEG